VEDGAFVGLVAVHTWEQFRVSYQLEEGTILKMDIEGAEFAVLDAMLAQPDVLPAALLVESHPWHASDPLRRIRSILTDFQQQGWSWKLRIAAESWRDFPDLNGICQWLPASSIDIIGAPFPGIRFYPWVARAA